MVLRELKRYIEDTGLKKTKVAERLGITREHFSAVLNSKHNLTPELENKIRELMR